MRFFAVRHLAKLSTRVKRGAALLDARYPDWASRIDLDRLDVASSVDCVLGQLHGYDSGLGAVALGFATLRDVVSHGFLPGPISYLLGREGEDSRSLTLLWAAEVICRRRRADARRLVAPPRVEVPVLV